MEKILKRPLSYTIRSYCFLTKPGIIFGNAVTASAGFAMASKNKLHLGLFFMMILGLSLIIASSCVFNNFIDRKLDAKMRRTKNRALPKGTISSQNAIQFAVALGLIGATTLFIFTNLLSMLIALLGLLTYVFVYSLSKYQTSLCTLLGSIAGSIPPVVGYTAVTGKVDLCALILFIIVAMWQMPHFFAIAIYRLKDYALGSIPILPLEKGMKSTKINMVFYIILFILACLALPALGFTSYLFAYVLTPLGAYWLYLGLKGFKAANDTIWARRMFLFSLVVIMAMGMIIPFSVT